MEDESRYAVPKWLFIAGVILVGVALFRYLPIGGRLIDLERPLQLLFFGGATFLVLLASFITYYEYHGIGPQDGIVRRGPHEPVVAITFDDGPNPSHTPQILDVLWEKKVKATFFVVGKHVEKYPELAKRIAEEGHDIGNHSYSHRDLVPATRRVVLNETGKTERAIFKATGTKTRLFRPPRGIYSNAARKLLVEEGYRIILWTMSTLDWRGVSPKRILRRVKLYIRSGGIILFHDGGALLRSEGASRKNVVEALPMVIDYLREKRGYKIVPISAMLQMLEEESEAVEAFEEAR
ncbi:MAG: polysaccharide deacetylase family protein [Actinomycetota bacterium]|nr:polysaccharide deacetylase family protein [Actinomycetota bacterium]